jgi:hypothetical protein
VTYSIGGYEVIRILFPIVFTLVCICGSYTASAHPADGYQANDLHPYYGTSRYGLGSEYDINDLYFIRPLPDQSLLTETEKYMLAGLAPQGPQTLQRSWISEIFRMVDGYYGRYGVIPGVFSPEIVRANALEPEGILEEHLEIFRNPITGEYPRLDAIDFSPGDVFIRALSEDEKAYLASIDPIFKGHWYEGVGTNLATGEKQRIEMLSSAVFYMRVYGYSEIIHTGLFYVYRFVE